MTIIRKGMLLTLALFLTACGGSDNSTPTDDTAPSAQQTLEAEFGLWLQDMTDAHIEPGYRVLAEEARRLASSASDFCLLATPGEQDLHQLQEDWRQTNRAWQHIQWLKLGPILEESRLFRLQFWPDSNEAVTKGLAALLNSPETVTPEYIASRNVGAQGLPAAEQLLFAKAAETSLLTGQDGIKRCEVLVAITENISSIGRTLVHAWSDAGGGYGQTFKTGGGEFNGRIDVVEEVVTNWLEQLEKVKDKKLMVPLGSDIPGLPDEAESPLSDESLTNIRINLDALSQIYTANGRHGFDDILTGHLQQDGIAREMTEILARLQSDIGKLQMGLTQAISEESERQLLQQVIDDLRDFRTVLAADFIQALDINIGFNSNDGD